MEDVLVSELSALLKLLDQETLSASTQEKKSSVRKLLQQISPAVTGTDYIYMNMPVYGNGTSFVESLFETFDCDLADLREATEDTKQDQQSLINETDAPQQACDCHLSIRPSTNPSVHPPIHSSIHHSILLYIHPSIHVSIGLSIHPFYHPSIHGRDSSVLIGMYLEVKGDI
uniref:Actin filament associated protein 1-like 1a n=1 Tax=Gadus morhua TaxID=8049 RepID=A0A8C5BCV5_GADMO